MINDMSFSLRLLDTELQRIMKASKMGHLDIVDDAIVQCMAGAIYEAHSLIAKYKGQWSVGNEVHLLIQELIQELKFYR